MKFLSQKKYSRLIAFGIVVCGILIFQDTTLANFKYSPQKTYSFDGVNDYIAIPESKNTNVQDEFTISVLVKSDDQRFDNATRQREIFFRKGSNLMFGYEYVPSEKKVWLRCYIQYTDGTSQEVEWRDMGSQVTRDGEWHAYRIAFKRGEYFKLYIDGKLVDNEAARDMAVKLSSVSNDIILGARQKSDGTIDRNLRASIKGFVVSKKSNLKLF